MNALGGIAATIDPTIEVAGKTIAGTFIDLLTRPELVEAAKGEFDRRVAEDPCLRSCRLISCRPRNSPGLTIRWPPGASGSGTPRLPGSNFAGVVPGLWRWIFHMLVPEACLEASGATGV